MTPPNAEIGHHIPEVVDALVIGAGPAGSVAAYLLARAGVSTLLVDKAAFPRSKVCGCCLSAAGQHLLTRIGLGAVLPSISFQRADQLHLRAGRSSAMLPIPSTAIVPRDTFDHALALAAQQAGARFIDRAVATIEPTAQDELPRVRMRSATDSKAAQCRCVIVADGLAGTSLPLMDAPRIQPQSRIGIAGVLHSVPVQPASIRMVVHPHGYVGSVRLPDGSSHVAAAIDPVFLRASASPTNAVTSMLGDESLKSGPCDEATWKGVPRLTRSRKSVQKGRVLVIGDAAGYVEPFTGEGMTWAIESAIRAVPAALQLIASTQRSATDTPWSEAYAQHIAPQHRRCHRTAWLLRHPPAVSAAMAILSRCPSLASMFHPRGFQPHVFLSPGDTL